MLPPHLIPRPCPQSPTPPGASRRSPQHHDLQRLASQVMMGQSTLGLTDLQRKMESQQATLAELLKVGLIGVVGRQRRTWFEVGHVVTAW